MRVLHVDGGRAWGGGQNQVRLLMRELERAGVVQSCLCPRGSPLEQRLRAERLPVTPVTWQTGLDPRVAFAIGSELKGADQVRMVKGADQVRMVVHCHDAHALQLAIVPAKLRRVPIIAARRMVFPTRPLKWNRAARVVAVSNAVRDVLVASGVAEGRVRVIHSGIDRAEIAGLMPLEPSLRLRTGVSSGEFLVGTVGSLVELKGQALIASAAERLAGVHWVIIGEGRARGAIEAAVAQHGVQDRVHLTGALPDARRALPELDLFVFPSQREALGTSVLEAMSCDIPVVAADAAGPAEILRPVHAETGASLYDAGDAAALAHAVERVKEDRELRERMIAAQRRRLEDFEIERCARATLALYEEVTSG